MRWVSASFITMQGIHSSMSLKVWGQLKIKEISTLLPLSVLVDLDFEFPETLHWQSRLYSMLTSGLWSVDHALRKQIIITYSHHSRNARLVPQRVIHNAALLCFGDRPIASILAWTIPVALLYRIHNLLALHCHANLFHLQVSPLLLGLFVSLFFNSCSEVFVSLFAECAKWCSVLPLPPLSDCTTSRSKSESDDSGERCQQSVYFLKPMPVRANSRNHCCLGS